MRKLPRLPLPGSAGLNAAALDARVNARPGIGRVRRRLEQVELAASSIAYEPFVHQAAVQIAEKPEPAVAALPVGPRRDAKVAAGAEPIGLRLRERRGGEQGAEHATRRARMTARALSIAHPKCIDRSPAGGSAGGLDGSRSRSRAAPTAAWRALELLDEAFTSLRPSLESNATPIASEGATRPTWPGSSSGASCCAAAATAKIESGARQAAERSRFRPALRRARCLAPEFENGAVTRGAREDANRRRKASVSLRRLTTSFMFGDPHKKRRLPECVSKSRRATQPGETPDELG